MSMKGGRGSILRLAAFAALRGEAKGLQLIIREVKVTLETKDIVLCPRRGRGGKPLSTVDQKGGGHQEVGQDWFLRQSGRGKSIKRDREMF